MSGHRIIQTIQSPFPAHNVWRRNEPVASDTIFSEVAAMHQWPNDGPDFVGRTSLVIDIYGMSSEKQFVNTLEDVIRKGERWTSSLPTALVSKFSVASKFLAKFTCPMHRRLAERTQLPTSKLCRTSLKVSKGTYNGT
jgi:hypothetical protein